MRYIEYGKENRDVILLLHGGGLSWWNYKEVAELLQEDYRVILPILDGHAESDKSFTTIEDNAADIIQFIDEHFGGYVLMIGGLSLGGQILLEMLTQRNDICKYAIIESALVIPSKITYSMIESVFGSCHGLISKKWFSKLQFKSLKIRPDLFEFYYRDTCAISKSDMIAILKANSRYSLKESVKGCKAKAYICVGGKESNIMKKSARIISQAMSGELQIIPSLYHGEFSINRCNDYVDKIRKSIAD